MDGLLGLFAPLKSNGPKANHRRDLGSIPQLVRAVQVPVCGARKLGQNDGRISEKLSRKKIQVSQSRGQTGHVPLLLNLKTSRGRKYPKLSKP